MKSPLLFFTALLATAATTNGFALFYYSDANCNNQIGEITGGSDEVSSVLAGLECQPPMDGAVAFRAYMDQCNMVSIFFGGSRKITDPSCPEFVCQNSEVTASYWQDNACKTLDGKTDIVGYETGWVCKRKRGELSEMTKRIQC